LGQTIVAAKPHRPGRPAGKFRNFVPHHTLGPVQFPWLSNATYVSSSKNATFAQLVQHAEPGLGTFPQRYAYNTKHWNGTGSPIVFVVWGEEPLRTLDVNFSPRDRPRFGRGSGPPPVTNSSKALEFLLEMDYFNRGETSMVLAEKMGAAVVVLEHRYFGLSIPVRNTSTASMRYNTVENAIADVVHFARTARLPFDVSGGSHAPETPWVIMGGSMGGAIASWTEFVAPGTFWASWASSATVEGVNSWAYTLPILENMPKNCSRDVARVVEHMDRIGRNGTKEDIKTLQAMFGLEGIKNFSDFSR
jgi:hypothetical protein